jgi:hypothetical protein
MDHQAERPQYYEGEYLSADDLAAIVRYARIGQARRALGAHLWGIGIGLELVERSLTGDDVEIILTPGVAWDGYGRGVVALVPQRLGLELFANFQADTVTQGVPVEVWVTYRELPAGSPGAGFSCPDDDVHGRVVETFRIELRQTPVADYHAVSVASRSVEARNVLKAFDTSKGFLYDESVPQQTFPESGDNPRWPIFVGVVRWKKDTGQPGRLIKRTDDDRNQTRRDRHYLGVVAETIAAPDGVLRLRDRAKDPNDPIVNYKPPIIAASAATPVVNDLVWCEGHLRVIGDARLQQGKLDYRVAKGGDDGVAMYLRRTFGNAPVARTTLDAFVGPPAPPPAPANAETRFAVSSTDAAGNPKECLTVVTDGRVGINADNPSNTLQVEGPTGIRHGYAYVAGSSGAPSAVFAFNAYAPAGGPWVFPDPAHKPAALLIDDDGGVPELKFQTNIAANPAAWDVQVVVKGDTGNVGIGNAAPAAKLHVHSANALQGDLRVFAAGSDFEYDGGTDKLFIFRDLGGQTAFLGGDIGIGTAAPTARLHLRSANPLQGELQLFSATADFEYEGGTDGLFVFRDAGGRTAFMGGLVGINETNPQARLDVNGDLHISGDAYKESFGVWWLPSDARLKKDVEPIAGALAKLLELRGVSFAWRDPARFSAGPGRYFGFVAQDVEQVFPEWVKTTPAGVKAVNPAGLEALLVEAVRELATRCDRLESEVADLRGQSVDTKKETARTAPKTRRRRAQPKQETG